MKISEGGRGRGGPFESGRRWQMPIVLFRLLSQHLS